MELMTTGLHSPSGLSSRHQHGKFNQSNVKYFLSDRVSWKNCQVWERTNSRQAFPFYEKMLQRILPPGVWSWNCPRFCGKLRHGSRADCRWVGKTTLRPQGDIWSFHIDSFPRRQICSKFVFSSSSKCQLSVFALQCIVGKYSFFFDALIYLWYL